MKMYTVGQTVIAENKRSRSIIHFLINKTKNMSKETSNRFQRTAEERALEATLKTQWKIAMRAKFGAEWTPKNALCRKFRIFQTKFV